MEKFLKSQPLDTAIPHSHVFIFIKEVDTTNWVLYLGGGGGNVIHELWYLGKGGGSDTQSKCFTFELFTLSVNIY